MMEWKNIAEREEEKGKIILEVICNLQIQNVT